jgi:hypothetical protein
LFEKFFFKNPYTKELIQELEGIIQQNCYDWPYDFWYLHSLFDAKSLFVITRRYFYFTANQPKKKLKIGFDYFPALVKLVFVLCWLFFILSIENICLSSNSCLILFGRCFVCSWMKSKGQNDSLDSQTWSNKQKDANYWITQSVVERWNSSVW